MNKLPAIPATAALLLLGLSACGGSDDTSTASRCPKAPACRPNPEEAAASRATTLNPDQLKIAAKFVACMRGLGYDMPDPSDPDFNFSPNNANGMSQQQLLKVRDEAAQCSNQVGGNAITGG
ncbi:hypothetical protein [Actinomadura decatromicini]|uniref:Lipoprotein n=1 Tax=Actinomadura decatromicini TaxID=2604572 RepID=A0A5D3FYG0_9ACTN|nr:hypothetical protein [Actinomadura decatromicini]TYK53062.1 hypothetical protein FXF68_04835 [Actinomadura decatromicini]